MANNENEIVDSDTNRGKQADCFVYCDIPNAINEDTSTSKNHKFFHKIFKYLIRSTVGIIQNRRKKFNIGKPTVSTPCKSEEKIATCSSLSSIVDNVIKSDGQTVTKIKREMIDAITSTRRSGEVFDKITHENLSGVGRFIRGPSYRYAEYTAKYVDNAAVPKRRCGPLCTGTQSNTADGEFSLRTSPDAFAKACQERRHADFILEKIAKVSDALTEKARRISAKEQAASILASVSVTSARYEMREETFESTEPLISSIIHVEEKPTAVGSATMVIMQPETRALVSSSSHFANSRSFRSDKSLAVSDIRVIPSIKHSRRTEHMRTVAVMNSERDDFRDIAVAGEKEKEEKESRKIIPLRSTLDKPVPVDEPNHSASVDSVIINCIPKFRKKDSKAFDLYQPNDIQTNALKREATLESSIKTSQVEEEAARIAKDILQKSTSFKYKKPKYRAKFRIDTYMTKEEKEQFKEISNDSDKLPKYGCLTFPPAKIKSSRSFNHVERTAMEMYQDCQNKPLRYLQPIRYCKDLIPSNIHFGRSKYCDIWTTPCFSSQNEATRNAILSHCHPLRDSCATGYHASCHSLVDSHVSSKYYNINDCAHRITFDNLLYTNAYCKKDAKYCYPHLNNIDNVRMGYYHCNDTCPVWNNNQHCGRDQSYYQTKGNLYFTHPWTSGHLL